MPTGVRKVPFPPIQCEGCRVEFEPRASHQRHCSVACYRRSWRDAHRQHVRVYHREWRQANPQRRAERSEAAKARKREYDRKRWRETHPHVQRVHQVKSPQERAAQLAEYERRRRARKVALSPFPFPPRLIEERFAYFGHRCWVCGRRGKMTADHVKPLSAGGLHIPSNIRPACRSCNSRKQDEWWGVSRLHELKSQVAQGALRHLH